MILSRTHTAQESVTVQVCSNIQGRSGYAQETVVVTARCRASGFKLLSLRASDDNVVEVTVGPEYLSPAGGDDFMIDTRNLSRYVTDIFGPGVVAEAFSDQFLRLRFLEESFRKVPLVPVSYVTFKPQYMALGGMELSADSVLVYGLPERISSIDKIRTEPVSLKDLKRDAHGIVNLEVPADVRLSMTEVGYKLPVGRYVEIRESLKIDARNVPLGTEFVLSPSSAEVLWRCSFPLRERPSGHSGLYVDYREFERSLTGKCIIRLSDVPDGVIDYEINPEVCLCLEKSNEK